MDAADQSKDSGICQEVKLPALIPSKEIEINIKLSLLSITKMCLELYLSWRFIDENKIDVSIIIWFALLMLHFSYNVIMAAAIVYSYKNDFRDHSRFTKNFLITLCIFDLDSILPFACYWKTGFKKNKIIQIIHEKINFICKLSILQLCSLCYTMGSDKRDVNLEVIFLLLAYFFMIAIQYQTVGEQIRILLVFYIGAMIKVEFFLSCENLTCTLLFNESILIFFILIASLIVMLRQKNFKSAFASRFAFKEFFRLMFFKPTVQIKEFDYISSPSIPSLIKLYIFKTKFKHIGYIWRIIEHVILSSYYLAERDQFSDQAQKLHISSSYSYGNFHYVLNIVLCCLSYSYAIYLFIRVIKIIKFIPVLSDEVINELELIQRNDIRARKDENYIWQPSYVSDFDSNNTNHNNNQLKQKGNSEFHFKSTYMKRYEFLQKESLSQKKTSDLEICKEFRKTKSKFAEFDEKINQNNIQNNQNSNVQQISDNQQINYNQSSHCNNNDKIITKKIRNHNKAYKFSMIKVSTPNNDKKRMKKYNSYSETIGLETFSKNINQQQNQAPKQKKKIQFVQQMQQDYTDSGVSQIERDVTQQSNKSPSLQDNRTVIGTKNYNSPSLQDDRFSMLQQTNQQDESKAQQQGNTFYMDSCQFQPQNQTNKTEEMKTEFTTQHITSPSNVVLLQSTHDEFSRKNTNNNNNYNNNILYTNNDDSVIEINHYK